jgi:CheY-like chemotaxis protein
MKNVLLIDDDHICNFLMSKYLERIGLTKPAQFASNGRQGIELLMNLIISGSVMPDLIFLDIRMPIMDGFGFLEAFGNLSFPEKKNIKIVMVSSSNDVTDINRAKKMGITDYLVKPVSESILKIILQNPGTNSSFTLHSIPAYAK